MFLFFFYFLFFYFNLIFFLILFFLFIFQKQFFFYFFNFFFFVISFHRVLNQNQNHLHNPTVLNSLKIHLKTTDMMIHLKQIHLQIQDLKQILLESMHFLRMTAIKIILVMNNLLGKPKKNLEWKKKKLVQSKKKLILNWL